MENTTTQFAQDMEYAAKLAEFDAMMCERAGTPHSKHAQKHRDAAVRFREYAKLPEQARVDELESVPKAHFIDALGLTTIRLLGFLGLLRPSSAAVGRDSTMDETQMIAEGELRRELEAAIEKAGSQRAFAKKLGFSEQFICDVMKGRREISDNLASALGYRRVVMFVPRPNPI